LSYRP